MSSSPTASLVLADLRAALDVPVITPGDAEYDEARQIFHGGVDPRPAAIVRPATSADVARVVTFARQNGIPMAVRGGGHGNAGHSWVNDGLVLDLRGLRTLEIDVEGRTAWAGTGLTAGEYTTAVGEHGFATGFGDAGSVGIGGITLGGGIGYLTRKYGLTIDSVLAAEVVTADGACLQADADSHPDLFWAIRGGGGNFGIVTRLKYRLHPVDQVVGGMLILPATPETIVAIIDASEAAPEALTTIVNVMPAPPMPFLPEAVHGQLVAMILLCYDGDAEAGARAVAPLRAIAPPLADMVRPMRYPELFPPDDPSYKPTAVGKTHFIDHVDRAAAERIVDALNASDASVRVTQLRVLGGAMARVPEESTAFGHRTSPIMATVAAFYDGPADRPRRQAWVNELAGALKQGDMGTYVNFLGDEGEARVREAYPSRTWERLAAIKARYDPANFFCRNQNVPPAA